MTTRERLLVKQTKALLLGNEATAETYGLALRYHNVKHTAEMVAMRDCMLRAADAYDALLDNVR